MAKKAAAVWRDHGALEYREYVGADLDVDCGPGFFKGIGAKRGETVIFSWISYKSKKQRDTINKKVMADPRLSGMGPDTMPFDMKRMTYGGFKVIVDL